MTALTDRVMDLIEESPGCTLDDLQVELPEYTRNQVRRAMQHLANTKRARCERQSSKGRGRGSVSGRYWVSEPPAPVVHFPRVASVWELGSRA